jgi:UDP-2,3-diacylglucosamine hydrolase
LSGVEPAKPLAILCGGGGLALEAARLARANGLEVFLIGIVGSASSEIEAFPHVWVRLGEAGKLFAALREREIADMAIIGSVRRPEFSDLSLDWGAIKRAREIARLLRGGDDGLLNGVARLLELEGLRIVGPRDFAPQLLAPVGWIAGRAPDGAEDADIAFGAALLGALSPFDVGQGAVVAHARVLAVEAAEGTDAMLARVAEMRASGRLRSRGRAGVFVKAAKRGQDMRLDLPTVGLATIAAAASAELSGLAIAAGEVLIAERAAFASAAEAAGLFVVGWAP